MNEASADILFDLGFAAGSEKERNRIIAILEAERDNWVKPGVFNYKVALTTLIERIKE